MPGPLLESISEAGRRALLERSFRRSFATEEVLWVAGDAPLGLTIVLEGRVRVVKMLGGRQTVIHWGEQGSTLGEIPFFTGNVYPATAIAAEPTTCLFVDRRAFDDSVKADSTIAHHLLETMASRVEKLVKRVAQLSSHSVQSRLAEFLLDRAQRNPARLSGEPFSLGMTQERLAEELGTVREVVARSLRAFIEEGVIAPAGSGRYRIEHIEMLERLSEAEP